MARDVRRLGALAMAVLMAVSLAACSNDDGITVSARFEDVGDLAEGAPVMVSDIQVGKVTDIRLAGSDAMIEMSIDPEAEVPTDVTARVRRTSVLGERIIDLVIAEGAGDTLLADGDRLNDTEVRSDLESLVAEGSEVIGAIAAADLAVMIQEGGRGFGGNGRELRGLLNNYSEIVTAYASRGEELQGLIDSLGSFNATIARESTAHERALENTRRSFEVLSEESGRLERAIVSLNRLARGSRGFLNAHVDEMKNFFAQMRVILGQLEGQQRDIERLLRFAPHHNRNTQLVEYVEFNQVVQDFVICGLNDDPDDPARQCKGGG